MENLNVLLEELDKAITYRELMLSKGYEGCEGAGKKAEQIKEYIRKLWEIKEERITDLEPDPE